MINLPAFVKTPKDEKKWSKAKAASDKETDKGSKGFYKLANYIFHRMKKNQTLEKNEELRKDLEKILSPKPVSASVPNPMKTGEQSTLGKLPKTPGIGKSESSDVSIRKLIAFIENKKQAK